MSVLQRLPASLTPLDVVLNALLTRLQPVAPVELALADALGCIAARAPKLAAHPSRDMADVDGFAFCARDLVGASSYSPLLLTASPPWVAAGEAMPAGCDCVVDVDSVDTTGPVAQAMSEAVPGQGVRRAGSDLAEGSAVPVAGRRIQPTDLLIARAVQLKRLHVRRPRLHIVNIPGATLAANLIAENAFHAGAEVSAVEAVGRDPATIADALETNGCDLLLTVGGSGVGRHDATLLALAARGAVITHGIALQPGRTSGGGHIGRTPVVVLPGAPDRALAVWWTLALPALDRLSGRSPRMTLSLPLARKIASGVGLAEIVLLERKDEVWAPLAKGELSLEAISRAEAWLAVPGGSEGFAAGAIVSAYLLRE